MAIPPAEPYGFDDPHRSFALPSGIAARFSFVGDNRIRSLPRAACVSQLSFVAGFVDVVGFISIARVFTSHITGNIVLLGSGAAHLDAQFARRLLVLPVFVAAVALTVFGDCWARRNRFRSERLLLFGEALVLLVFMIAGLHVQPAAGEPTPPEHTVMLVAALGAFAMGIHNAITHEARFPNTSAMTSNLTQFTIALTDICAGTDSAKDYGQLWANGNALGCFVLGVILV